MTDTPEKEALENEQRAKKIKNTNKTIKSCKNLSFKHKTKKMKVNKNKNGATKDEYYCLVCAEPYSNSRMGEKWIQCIGCKNWSHAECAPSGPSYICQNCDSDDSDYIH